MEVQPHLALALVLAGCAGTGTSVSQPIIVAPAAWRSDPDPILENRRHTPVRITIHHAGVLWKPGDDPYKKLAGLQSWGKRDKHWPDVPYHYLIAPDGRIFAGRPLAYEGETNTEYDVEGHALVQLWGNFEKQRVSLAQLRSTVRLVAWLCVTRGISPETIAGHKDWSKQTACPGQDLHRYIADGQLRKWVEQEIAGQAPGIELRAPLPDGPTELVPTDQGR